MSLRVFLISLAATGLTSAAFAQEAPVARAHGDDAAALNTPAVAAKPAAASPPAATSAPASTCAQTAASGDATDRQIAEWLKADANPVQPLDPRAETSDPQSPRRIHGEVGAYVSNRGYGGYAASSLPLGQASELDVAVSGEHVHTRRGNANPRSLAVGLYLDGGDVNRWLSRDKCNVPRWGVSLPGDPQVLADGSCRKADPAATPPPAR